MRRNAFTLIELLVVVGIIVGIVGVAMLSLTDFRRESELRAAADRLESVAELARAEALRTGKPIELILRLPVTVAPGGATRSARLLTRALDPVGSAGAESTGADPEPARARTRTELPRWLILAPDPGQAAPVPARSEGYEVRMAVFLPDGSALSAEPLRLEDRRSGARLTCSIDALTGSCAAAIDWNPAPAEDGAEDTPAREAAP